jgi:hypothetical protein
MGVTVVDAWQGRGLGSALLACLSDRPFHLGLIADVADHRQRAAARRLDLRGRLRRPDPRSRVVRGGSTPAGS